MLLAIVLLSGCRPSARFYGPRGAPPAEALARVNARFAGIDDIHAELAERRVLGRAVLLNFWATWCGPCIEELPDLVDASRDFTGAGLEVIGVALDAWVIGTDSETDTRVRSALAHAGAEYLNIIYRGDQGPLRSAFALPGPIPYSILYDRNGGVVTRWNSQVEIDDLRREFDRLPGLDGRDGGGGGAHTDSDRQGAG
jgi:hypothetical protein